MSVESDRQGFLEAVVADKDDDTPRLVYADWLRERGETDRAELINTQVRRARKECPECGGRDNQVGPCGLTDYYRECYSCAADRATIEEIITGHPEWTTLPCPYSECRGGQIIHRPGPQQQVLPCRVCYGSGDLLKLRRNVVAAGEWVVCSHCQTTQPATWSEDGEWNFHSGSGVRCYACGTDVATGETTLAAVWDRGFIDGVDAPLLSDLFLWQRYLPSRSETVAWRSPDRPDRNSATPKPWLVGLLQTTVSRVRSLDRRPNLHVEDGNRGRHHTWYDCTGTSMGEVNHHIPLGVWRCLEGWHAIPGHGCLRGYPTAGDATDAFSRAVPKFAADCVKAATEKAV